MYSYVSEGTCVLSGRQPEPSRDYGRGSTSPSTARARGAEQLPAGVLLLSLPAFPASDPPRGKSLAAESGACSAGHAGARASLSPTSRVSRDRCAHFGRGPQSGPVSLASACGGGPLPRLQRPSQPLTGGKGPLPARVRRPSVGIGGSVPRYH